MLSTYSQLDLYDSVYCEHYYTAQHVPANTILYQALQVLTAEQYITT